MSSGQSETIRILIADDHQVIRSGVRGMLSACAGFEIVGEASNGRQAVEMYEKYLPDVALVDLRMPEFEGVEVVRRVRLRHPNARIIILTTYDTDEDIDLALQAGAKAYLLKDVTGQELGACVRDVFNGRTRVAPAVAAKLAERVTRVQLTARELDVLRLLSDGKANKQIASDLGVTESTVKLHTNNLFQKLGVSSRTEAMKVALQRGLIRLP